MGARERPVDIKKNEPRLLHLITGSEYWHSSFCLANLISKRLQVFPPLLGVKHPTIYRYENDRIPDGDMFLKIAALDPLKRGVEWLLTGQTGALYKEGAGGEGRVVEAPETYLNPKCLRLVRAVKKLALEANDDVIDALLKNVEVFSQVPKKRKDTDG